MDGELRAAEATGAAAGGFSLIELLIVVAVMAVLAVGASLALRPDSVAADVERFRSTHDALRDLAILGQERRGLQLSRRALRPLRETGAGWQASDTALSFVRGISWTVQGARLTGRDVPDILFLPNGQTSVFSVTFQRGPRCESDGWGGLECR